jgi:TonB-linked SusC/RagA family outer membrane protein
VDNLLPKGGGMMKPRTFSATVCAGALVLLFGATVRDTVAQSAAITGKVVGRQGEPLGGAIVAISELGIAVATTTSGSYTLTVAPGKTSGQTVTLRVRYIGYKPEARQITLTPGTQTVDVELKSDPMQLDAVVVTGVAEATEAKNLTFAVGHVDASQLNQVPAVSALGSLEGKVAGVRVIQANGAPGGEPTIRLRGSTGLTSPSSCNTQPCPSTSVPGPLIVVDGTITHYSLADISPQDIERVEVVKGAAASSLYGSNAADGVIQIFTKRGDRLADGKLVVTVRNEYGQSFRPKLIPTAHAHAYLSADHAYTDASGNTVLKGDFIDAAGVLVGVGGVPHLKPDAIADVPYSTYPHPVNFDVQGDLLTHGPYYTNYVSVGQRRGNLNYNVSFENTKQEGVMLLLKGYNRQNFRLNLDQALTPRLDLSAGAFFGKSNNNSVAQGPGSPFFVTGFLEPYINLFAPNPDGTPYSAYISHQQPNAQNPLYTLANEKINTDRKRYSAYGKASYRLTDWLSLEGHYNYDYEASNYSDVTPKGFLSATGVAGSGSLIRTDSGGREFNTGVAVTGVRSFRLGSLSVRNTTKAAYEYEDQTATNFTLTANKFTVVNTPEFSAVDFSQLSPGSSDATIRSKNYYVVSGFNVSDRYLVDGLVRRDGSSLFGSESRWQTYYRASGAYRLSQDLHIKGIDELKLRASYGTAGLRPTFDAQYETYSVVGGIPAKHTLGNTALKPARSAELELGGNVDFLSRFSLEYSYSRKETKDQILLVPLSSATGYLNQWQNAATLLGKTHELSLGVVLADRPEFSWRLNIAADRTRQTITQLNTAPFLVGPGGYGGNNDVTQDFKIAAGETFGVFYGTKIVRTFAELCDDPAKKLAGCGPGKTYDPANYIRNEDGYLVPLATYHTINEAIIFYVDPAGNKTVKIGDVNPDFNASFTTNLRYKGFSLYALVDWVQGGNIYNGTRQWAFGTSSTDRSFDQSGKPAVNCTGTTDPTHCPYSTGKKPTVYYAVPFYNGINPIDFFVENGTYVKIKEVNVSYAFSRSQLEGLHLGLNNLRVGVIGHNLFTFTKYSGYDPEVAGLTGDSFSFRWDGFSYPNFRTFTGFMEIDF